MRAAENARKNRAEIVAAYSQGELSRRNLLKLGIFTAAGTLLPIPGLSPFVGTARADSGGIPTGTPPSPGLKGLDFTQPLLRLDVLPRKPIPANPDPITNPNPLNPAPLSDGSCNETPVSLPAELNNGIPFAGPCEGRPPGPDWSHQRFQEFAPQIAIEVTQEGAKPNAALNIPFRFHPSLPDQDIAHVWTFNGTLPPKLVMARYGEPLLFRHHNQLPPNIKNNGGFGRYTLTTHHHNGHNPGESDGFTGAFFFPGQFYDYHWPMILAGHDTINAAATDIFAGGPADDGGINKVPGDWHETMSTHWFHDHMFSFTAQNVYKGNAAMLNLYSARDRGSEVPDSYGVNLCLPSGTAKSWGNLDYDVNLMLSDKAWDKNGQLFFDIFNTDGFLGDAMTVNLAYKPYFEVEARKYRFRILNASVSRFFKLALSDGSPMIQIANDGNLLPNPVTLTALDQQGIAERYDVVIDFSRYQPGQKVWFVNLCEHEDGRGPKGNVSLPTALAGQSSDPCVGKFLEFRVIPTTGPDNSKVPATLIPNPDLSKIPVSRQRSFVFGDGGSDGDPWVIGVNGSDGLTADPNRISASPKLGTREIWTLKNDGGEWDHPVHIHFEEGQILSRNGSARNVPAWEKGRKDVYRLRPDGTVTITMQFREFFGTYVEHCHNTVHEDHAMLLRWDPDHGLVPLPTPVPTPKGVTFLTPTFAGGKKS
jgi:FtsP/CotA-like multicopper oxidase with cupredoxin domain